MTDTLSAPDEERPYHHGDLKAALLREAEHILEHEGIQALTLRAAARRAGVSHAAPANHFGDLTGLLSELAALGYRRFSADLAAAMEAAGQDPVARLTAMGRAYVGFARACPGMFALMFRSERLDADRPALREARASSASALRAAARARTPGPAPVPATAMAQSAALWSLVHGFAMLLLDGRLQEMIGRFPTEAHSDGADALLEAVLQITQIGP